MFTCRDYRANELLDRYEAEGIDEATDEMQDMTVEARMEARAAAERELNKRERRENRRGLPGALEGFHHLKNPTQIALNVPVPASAYLT